MGNVVWADGHVKVERVKFLNRPAPPPVDLLLQNNVGDIDRDGDPRTDELWDLE
jgi:prepilin-type processing-associated H-X9-DG protein